MDQSYSESDVSLSPTKIFERLQILRQLQIMQRGKLQQHRLQYQDSPEITSSVTEIVSHFSNSTSYNTFRSLLQSSQEIPSEHNSCLEDISPRKEIDKDYIEGISALNLSQESAFITNSPVSNRSVSSKSLGIVSAQPKDVALTNDKNKCLSSQVIQTITKNQISLDEMPILSPKKDFEELVIEKLKTEKNAKSKANKRNSNQISLKTKKPFLRRGEGMMRFGIRKNDLVIQNTKALPWRKTNKTCKPVKIQMRSESNEPIEKGNKKNEVFDIQIISTKSNEAPPIEHIEESNNKSIKLPVDKSKKEESNCHSKMMESNNSKVQCSGRLTNSNIKSAKPQTHNGKHSIKSTKGQTWASVLTNEQDNFLRQLKQSDYYKNFVSPVKSTVSDSSCSCTPLQFRQDKERAEQNMFELLENKVTHESFNMNSSFFNRFLRKNNFECSGESTPLVLQKCLNDNPNLLHLHPVNPNQNRKISCCDSESCSDITEGSETCSSVSTCCSCKQVDHSSLDLCHSKNNNDKSNDMPSGGIEHEDKNKLKVNEKCPVDIVRKEESVNTDVSEMNAKLVATSELLKDRLRELEDEIETFRKENANLNKLREELDVERQKFYEEKTAIEQKYNEEKILSDYYLAEEKEKLHKQKQIYDKYVREMRGRLSKKDKDEVINLKKEITELKEEIRNKDAKSTCTIARLRNQIKLIEKDRKSLQDEIEKLKKENRRIQHSNDITRRLTNLKYLEQINKKLGNMSSKDINSETDIGSDVKYKAFEIERQSRSKKVQAVQTTTKRRAKSVPNLNVTSRYAKYFSQKDSVSDRDTNNLIKRHLVTNIESDNEEPNIENTVLINESDSEEENNLEKIYNERFQSFSPTSNHEEESELYKRSNKCNSNDGFFIQKSDVSRSLDHLNKSSVSSASIPSQRSYRSSKSPVNILEEYNKDKSQENECINNKIKSPSSILSNRISGCDRSATVLNKHLLSDKSLIPSPEPSSSKSSISKTNLNPIEIKKPDGSRELRFPNGNVKHMSADGKYSKFIYYNGDVKENFYNEGRIKYFYAETNTYHTTHADGLEVLEFSDGQVEKRYKDGSSEIRLPNGSVRYFDPKNEHVREEWRFPDGTALTVSASGEQRILFSNGQIEVHAKDHKRREFPDGTVKLVYNDGTSETRYASGRVRIKDKHGNLIMDSAQGQ